MKKTKILLFTAPLLFLASGIAEAGCSEHNAPYYHIQNGKITKSTASVSACGNIYDVFSDITFKDGVTLSSGANFDGNGKQTKEWFSLDNKKPVPIKGVKGVPASADCYATTKKAKTIYCLQYEQMGL